MKIVKFKFIHTHYKDLFLLKTYKVYTFYWIEQLFCISQDIRPTSLKTSIFISFYSIVFSVASHLWILRVKKIKRRCGYPYYVFNHKRIRYSPLTHASRPDLFNINIHFCLSKLTWQFLMLTWINQKGRFQAVVRFKAVW